jgi:hypothetical protein
VLAAALAELAGGAAALADRAQAGLKDNPHADEVELQHMPFGGQRHVRNRGDHQVRTAEGGGLGRGDAGR